MEDSRILAQAKKDLPLYLQDFNQFWNLTTNHFNDVTLTDCYATTLLFKNWQIVLNHVGIKNLDEILKELHEDINSSLFYAFLGQYRSAHMHLRSVVELGLQLLYFYQHEVEYEQWRSAEFRIKHDELTNYLKKHPHLKSKECDDLLNQIAVKWKEFSKHIHAEAPKYFQTKLVSAASKTISKTDIGIWMSNFIKTGYQINKLFLMFFKSKLNSFPSQNRDLLLRNMKNADLISLGIKTS